MDSWVQSQCCTKVQGKAGSVSHDSLPATNGPPAGASQQDSNLFTKPALHHSGIQPFDHSNCPAQAVDKGPSLRRAPTLHLPDQWESGPQQLHTGPQSCCEPACAGHRPSRQLQPPVVWRPNGYPPKHSRQPMEVGWVVGLRAVRQATHQTSCGPHQDVCRASLAIQEPGGFKHWSDLSPLAIVKHQISRATWSPPAMQLRAWRPLQPEGWPQKRQGPPPHTSTPRRPPKMARKSDLDRCEP